MIDIYSKMNYSNCIHISFIIISNNQLHRLNEKAQRKQKLIFRNYVIEYDIFNECLSILLLDIFPCNTQYVLQVDVIIMMGGMH